MAQQDPPAPAPTNLNIKALIVGVLALLGVGGADAAGYTIDPQLAALLKGLGGGSILLILYLELRVMPVALRIAARDRREAAEELEVDAAPQPMAPLRTGKTLAVVRPKEQGRVRIDVILAFILCGVLAGGLFACGWLKSEAKTTASNVVDCSTAKAKDAIKQFAPTVEQLIANTVDTAGRADWNMIGSATKDFAADVGGCVLASAVSRLLAPIVALGGAPASSPLELDKANLAQGWEQLRAQRYSGATFQGAGP